MRKSLQRTTQEDTPMADRPPTPRWVKLFGIIVIILILLMVIMMLLPGGHGPSRHIPSGDRGADTPPIEQFHGLSGHMPPIEYGVRWL